MDMEVKENPLRKIRRSKKFSVSELAKRSDLTERTIYNIETGIRFGSTETLRKLAEVLGVTIEELLPPLPKGSPSDDADEDLAMRLVEEELSRFPKLKEKTTSRQKKRLAEIVRKYLKNTIESLREAV